MTISNQRVKDVYVADGSNRNWEYTFPVLAKEDIKIKIISENGNEEEVTTAFEIIMQNNLVIYPSADSTLNPLAEGTKIILYRKTPITQEIDLLRQGTLDAETLEKGYDKRTLVEQELAEKVDRAIKFPMGDVRNTNAAEYLNTVTTAAQNAAQSASSANVSEGNAKNSEVLATMAADAATQKAEQAVLAAETATAKANAASQSEASAKISEESASESKSAAQISADLANASAVVASEKEALARGYTTATEKAADKAENAQLIAEGAARRAEEAAQRVERVMEYKGSVPTFDDLPFDSEVGDVWNVSDTGDNYAWDGEKWDKFSGLSIPDNVYTQNNLLGGKNIEIKEEIIGEEIDDNTVLLLHLDGDFTDSSKNGSSTTYNTTDQDKFEFLNEYNGTQKFGHFLHNNSGSSSVMFEGAQTISKVNGSFTIDYWFLTGATTSDIVSCVLYGNDAYQFVISPNESRMSINLGAETNYQSINKTVAITSNIWHHVAIVYSAEESLITFYIDGEEKCVFSGYSLSFGSGATNFAISLNGNVCKDEVRLSNVARYKGTFTPLTKPYGEVEKTGKSFVNCTLKIPDVGYTQDNLVSGENIAFKQVVIGGGIDQDTLACWHFDTNRKDVVNGYNYTGSSGTNSIGTSYAKFGEGGLFSQYYANNDFSLATSDEWTVDTWWKPLSKGSYYAVGVGTVVSSYGTPQYVHVKFDTNYNMIFLAENYTITNPESINSAYKTEYTFTLNEYYHLAVQKDKNGVVSAYVNGEMVLRCAGNFTNQSSSLGYNGNYSHLDETRVSKIARYSGNFTPPTEPYSAAEALDKWKIDNTLTKLSQLENDSEFVKNTVGARLNLFGKDYSNSPGEFALYANNGTDSKILVGKPDGTLAWDGVEHTAWGMPSTKYEELTLGANASQYTAPANGWFYFAKTAGAAGERIQLQGSYLGISVWSAAGGNPLSCYLPIKKGDKVAALYSASSDTNTVLRFIYAEGAK